MKIHLNGKTVSTKKKTIRELLMEKDINPETVLVKRGRKMVPGEEKLKKGDHIKTLKIVSGG